MQRKKLIPILLFVLLSTSIVGLSLWYFVFKGDNPFDLRSGAGGSDSLHVVIDKSYLASNDSYTLYVYELKGNKTQKAYTGFLDVKSTSCDTSGVCKSNPTVKWGNYQVVNGKIKITLTNASSGRITAYFKPNGSDWGWSNPITVSIGTYAGLEDVSKWWIMPSGSNNEATFKGTNYVYNKAFTTTVGYDAPKNQCSTGNGQMMYFMKKVPEAYWGAKVPWFDGAANQNILWSLTSWQKKTGWNDTYLTSAGYESYKYGSYYNVRADLFTPTSFVYGRRISSGETKYPPYTLAPLWVGEGWGVINEKQVSKPQNGVAMCNVTPIDCTTTSCNGFWSAQATFISGTEFTQYNLQNLAKYGKLLRISYLESTGNYYTQTANPPFGWREDWYFAKGVGLVQIDTKHFGKAWNNDISALTVANLNKCVDDDDCLRNIVMQKPHIRMTRQ